MKQERDLQTLRFEKELRDLQLKADADFKKAQVVISLPLYHVKLANGHYRLLNPQVIVPFTKVK